MCNADAGGQVLKAETNARSANAGVEDDQFIDAGGSTSTAPPVPSTSAVQYTGHSTSPPEPTGINFCREKLGRGNEHFGKISVQPVMSRGKMLERMLREMKERNPGRNLTKEVRVEERVVVKIRNSSTPVDAWIENIITYYLEENGEYICPHCRNN